MNIDKLVIFYPREFPEDVGNNDWRNLTTLLRMLAKRGIPYILEEWGYRFSTMGLSYRVSGVVYGEPNEAGYAGIMPIAQEDIMFMVAQLGNVNYEDYMNNLGQNKRKTFYSMVHE